LWQEGHTAHATAEEAQEETLKMLDIYAEFCESVLALPVLKGQKTDKEKFAGANATYCIESLMHDGKALQSGTTHNFGDGFAKAFGIQFSDADNNLQYAHQTSWGVSTRLIGALIMVHSDNNGLVLPPLVAPTQVAVIPIAQHKEGVLDVARKLYNSLSKDFRTILDDSDRSPGWKFSEHEMKGVAVRVEIGPKDIENNQAVLVRRDTREKTIVSLDNLEAEVSATLSKMQVEMLEKAIATRNEKTYTATNMAEFENILNTTPGFIKAMWCGSIECETKIKELTNATSRCIPFEQETVSNKCICCEENATKLVIWGKSY